MYFYAEQCEHPDNIYYVKSAVSYREPPIQAQRSEHPKIRNKFNNCKNFRKKPPSVSWLHRVISKVRSWCPGKWTRKSRSTGDAK